MSAASVTAVYWGGISPGVHLVYIHEVSPRGALPPFPMSLMTHHIWLYIHVVTNKVLDIVIASHYIPFDYVLITVALLCYCIIGWSRGAGGSLDFSY